MSSIFFNLTIQNTKKQKNTSIKYFFANIKPFFIIPKKINIGITKNCSKLIFYSSKTLSILLNKLFLSNSKFIYRS